jgi:hypothetical protein
MMASTTYRVEDREREVFLAMLLRLVQFNVPTNIA